MSRTDPCPRSILTRSAARRSARSSSAGPCPRARSPLATTWSTPSLTWFGNGTPRTPVLPYASLGEPDEDNENLNTAGDQTADGHLEITCYAATKKAARKLGDLVASALNDAPLAYTAGTHVYLRQSGRTAMPDAEPGPGGSPCWNEIRQFHFIYALTIN